MSEAAIEKAVLAALDELNETLPPEDRIAADPQSALYGPDGKLDSLSLVNLIVAIEEEIADALEVTVTLADERAMSRKRSPFLTVGSLTEFALERALERNG